MKVEKLDGSLEKGFRMLRKDNNPWRARESSLSTQWLTEEIVLLDKEGRREHNCVARL